MEYFPLLLLIALTSLTPFSPVFYKKELVKIHSKKNRIK